MSYRHNYLTRAVPTLSIQAPTSLSHINTYVSHYTSQLAALTQHKVQAFSHRRNLKSQIKDRFSTKRSLLDILLYGNAPHNEIILKLLINKQDMGTGNTPLHNAIFFLLQYLIPYTTNPLNHLDNAVSTSYQHFIPEFIKQTEIHKLNQSQSQSHPDDNSSSSHYTPEHVSIPTTHSLGDSSNLNLQSIQQSSSLLPPHHHHHHHHQPKPYTPPQPSQYQINSITQQVGVFERTVTPITHLSSNSDFSATPNFSNHTPPYPLNLPILPPELRINDLKLTTDYLIGIDYIEYLLSLGASINTPNNHGQTPLLLALAFDLNELIPLFCKYQSPQLFSATLSPLSPTQFTSANSPRLALHSDHRSTQSNHLSPSLHHSPHYNLAPQDCSVDDVQLYYFLSGDQAQPHQATSSKPLSNTLTPFTSSPVFTINFPIMQPDPSKRTPLYHFLIHNYQTKGIKSQLLFSLLYQSEGHFFYNLYTKLAELDELLGTLEPSESKANSNQLVSTQNTLIIPSATVSMQKSHLHTPFNLENDLDLPNITPLEEVFATTMQHYISTRSQYYHYSTISTSLIRPRIFNRFNNISAPLSSNHSSHVGILSTLFQYLPKVIQSYFSSSQPATPPSSNRKLAESVSTQQDVEFIDPFKYSIEELNSMRLVDSDTPFDAQYEKISAMLELIDKEQQQDRLNTNPDASNSPQPDQLQHITAPDNIISTNSQQKSGSGNLILDKFIQTELVDSCEFVYPMALLYSVSLSSNTTPTPARISNSPSTAPQSPQTSQGNHTTQTSHSTNAPNCERTLKELSTISTTAPSFHVASQAISNFNPFSTTAQYTAKSTRRQQLMQNNKNSPRPQKSLFSALLSIFTVDLTSTADQRGRFAEIDQEERRLTRRERKLKQIEEELNRLESEVRGQPSQPHPFSSHQQQVQQHSVGKSRNQAENWDQLYGSSKPISDIDRFAFTLFDNNDPVERERSLLENMTDAEKLLYFREKKRNARFYRPVLTVLDDFVTFDPNDKFEVVDHYHGMISTNSSETSTKSQDHRFTTPLQPSPFQITNLDPNYIAPEIHILQTELAKRQEDTWVSLQNSYYSMFVESENEPWALGYNSKDNRGNHNTFPSHPLQFASDPSPFAQQESFSHGSPINKTSANHTNSADNSTSTQHYSPFQPTQLAHIGPQTVQRTDSSTSARPHNQLITQNKRLADSYLYAYLEHPYFFFSALATQPAFATIIHLLYSASTTKPLAIFTHQYQSSSKLAESPRFNPNMSQNSSQTRWLHVILSIVIEKLTTLKRLVLLIQHIALSLHLPLPLYPPSTPHTFQGSIQLIHRTTTESDSISAALGQLGDSLLNQLSQPEHLLSSLASTAPALLNTAVISTISYVLNSISINRSDDSHAGLDTWASGKAMKTPILSSHSRSRYKSSKQLTIIIHQATSLFDDIIVLIDVFSYLFMINKLCSAPNHPRVSTQFSQLLHYLESTYRLPYLPTLTRYISNTIHNHNNPSHQPVHSTSRFYNAIIPQPLDIDEIYNGFTLSQLITLLPTPSCDPYGSPLPYLIADLDVLNDPVNAWTFNNRTESLPTDSQTSTLPQSSQPDHQFTLDSDMLDLLYSTYTKLTLVPPNPQPALSISPSFIYNLSLRSSELQTRVKNDVARNYSIVQSHSAPVQLFSHLSQRYVQSHSLAAICLFTFSNVQSTGEIEPSDPLDLIAEVSSPKCPLSPFTLALLTHQPYITLYAINQTNCNRSGSISTQTPPHQPLLSALFPSAMANLGTFSSTTPPLNEIHFDPNELQYWCFRSTFNFLSASPVDFPTFSQFALPQHPHLSFLHHLIGQSSYLMPIQAFSQKLFDYNPASTTHSPFGQNIHKIDPIIPHATPDLTETSSLFYSASLYASVDELELVTMYSTLLSKASNTSTAKTTRGGKPGQAKSADPQPLSLHNFPYFPTHLSESQDDSQLPIASTYNPFKLTTKHKFAHELHFFLQRNHYISYITPMVYSIFSSQFPTTSIHLDTITRIQSTSSPLLTQISFFLSSIEQLLPLSLLHPMFTALLVHISTIQAKLTAALKLHHDAKTTSETRSYSTLEQPDTDLTVTALQSDLSFVQKLLPKLIHDALDIVFSLPIARYFSSMLCYQYQSLPTKAVKFDQDQINKDVRLMKTESMNNSNNNTNLPPVANPPFSFQADHHPFSHLSNSSTLTTLISSIRPRKWAEMQLFSIYNYISDLLSMFLQATYSTPANTTGHGRSDDQCSKSTQKSFPTKRQPSPIQRMLAHIISTYKFSAVYPIPAQSDESDSGTQFQPSSAIINNNLFHTILYHCPNISLLSKLTAWLHFVNPKILPELLSQQNSAGISPLRLLQGLFREHFRPTPHNPDSSQPGPDAQQQEQQVPRPRIPKALSSWSLLTKALLLDSLEAFDPDERDDGDEKHFLLKHHKIQQSQVEYWHTIHSTILHHHESEIHFLFNHFRPFLSQNPNT